MSAVIDFHHRYTVSRIWESVPLTSWLISYLGTIEPDFSRFDGWWSLCIARLPHLHRDSWLDPTTSCIFSCLFLSRWIILHICCLLIWRIIHNFSQNFSSQLSDFSKSSAWPELQNPLMSKAIIKNTYVQMSCTRRYLKSIHLRKDIGASSLRFPTKKIP